MTNKGLWNFLDKTIEYCFLALFFFVPLILTPINYELFEYNKMMLTYGLTTIIVAAWFGKMILQRTIIIARTALDLPIALFFLSQVASYLSSIDRHVSFWGYYSRFHGGLLSTITYIILYYAFVSNFLRDSRENKPLFSGLTVPLVRSHKSTMKQWSNKAMGQDCGFRINKLLVIILSSATLVSLYGILEHFGIDKDLWVQDVQNRVFSTLGQPNWLAAYLAILIPVAVALNFTSSQALPIKPRVESQISNLKSQNYTAKLKNKFSISTFIFYLLASIFYLALLYTKSRSGFIGFWVANSIFWLFLFGWYKTKVMKALLIFNFSFFILNFIVGSPFASFNRFTTLAGLKQIVFKQAESPKVESVGPALETQGTESTKIRHIVWQGAIEIARHYPLFGSGVETFAFAYYQFRPSAHNLTSEWDFLYNKAHNEYLNYAATTGLFGLGSYLALIGSFVWLSIKKFKVTLDREKLLASNSHFALCTLHFAFFAGYVSILVTNFSGFSVVPVSLFFWLIPAINFLIWPTGLTLAPKSPLLPGEGQTVAIRESNREVNKMLSFGQISSLSLVLLVSLIILSKLASLWLADVFFSKGYHLSRTDQYSQAYQSLSQAIKLNSKEPLYHDELSFVLGTLTLAAYQQNLATLAATLEDLAIKESDYAVSYSPNNVNFYKTRTRVFYALAQVDDKYNEEALNAISKAYQLAPTDAKVAYNLGLIKLATGQEDEALATFKQAIALKPDYRDPRWALALFYEEKGKIKETIEELKYILEHISPKDEQARKKLAELEMSQ